MKAKRVRGRVAKSPLLGHQPFIVVLAAVAAFLNLAQIYSTGVPFHAPSATPTPFMRCLCSPIVPDSARSISCFWVMDLFAGCQLNTAHSVCLAVEGSMYFNLGPRADFLFSVSRNLVGSCLGGVLESGRARSLRLVTLLPCSDPLFLHWQIS